MHLLTMAVLVSVSIAGCGEASGPGDATRGEGASGSSPSGSRLTPTEPPEDLTVSPPASKGSIRQLTGSVSEGVESGCLLLQAPDGLYLLVGGDRAMLGPGVSVVVTGEVDRELVTTCQQGTPFRVRSVRTT